MLCAFEATGRLGMLVPWLLQVPLISTTHQCSHPSTLHLSMPHLSIQACIYSPTHHPHICSSTYHPHIHLSTHHPPFPLPTIRICTHIWYLPISLPTGASIYPYIHASTHHPRIHAPTVYLSIRHLLLPITGLQNRATSFAA